MSKLLIYTMKKPQRPLHTPGIDFGVGYTLYTVGKGRQNIIFLDLFRSRRFRPLRAKQTRETGRGRREDAKLKENHEKNERQSNVSKERGRDR